LSSYLLPPFSEVVEMPLNAKLLVCSFLAAVVLCVTGGFDFRLSVQELGERLRPNQIADLVTAGLAPADFYPEPGETVDVTAMVRNRAVVAAPKVVVALFGDNAKIGSETVDLAAGDTRTLHFSWQPKAGCATHAAR
jgi:CARDB